MKVDENVFFREALRESEERHRVTLKTAMDGFFRTDMQGRILEVNNTYCQMSGYNEQELLTMNVVDIEAVHTAEMIGANIRSFAELGPKRFESHHRRKDGSLFDVEISGQYQPIAGGQVVVFVRDVTERKQTEERLRHMAEAVRRSEAYLAEAQRLSHTGSWAFDLAGNKYIYVSEECFRIFELDAQEGLPTREVVSRRIHPEDWDKVGGDFEKSLREKVDASSGFRLVLPSGTVKHIHVIRHPVLNEAGDVVELVGTAIDITERKCAEEALRLASAYNRSLIEASLDPLVTIDEQGKISDVNAATEQVTGYERSELIGTDFSDYFTEPEKARASYQKVFNQGFVRDYELEICNQNGEITPVLYNASVYRDDAGNVIGVFAAARDITRLKLAENELLSHLRFFQNMDRINQAMQGTNDIEQVMSDVLDSMLSIFECDRAFLVYPCDPDAPSFEAAMERTRPGYPARRGMIPAAPDTARHFQLYLASSGAVTLGPGCDYPLEIARFGEKSKIMIPSYPKTGKPWVLGMHQCSYPRVWTPDERKLLEEIARRMGDALTSLLAHRDLHESEERHRVTLRTAMDGFFRTDMQGRILDVNEAYCRMSGYSEQELLTMHVADISVVRTAEMVIAEIRRATEEGSQRFESIHRRKDGSLFDVEISAQHQPLAGGQVVVFVRDITTQKHAEEERSRLAAIVESSDDAIISKDLDGTITSWNEGAERLYGYSAAEALGRPISILLPPDQQDQMTVLLRRIREGSRIKHYETQRIRKDGQMIDVSLTLSPIRNYRGEIIGASAIARDISVQKRAEEALRLASVYNRSLIEASLDPLVTIDPEGRISDVNAATEQVTGYTRSELIGTDFSDYFTEPEKARSGYRQVFSEGLVRDYELNIRHRDGNITPVLYNASVYRDEAGMVIGVFAAARDITERRQAQEALQELLADLGSRVEERTKELSEANESLQAANKELESFSYTVSHDLRAPLRAIDGFSRMVLKGYADKLDDEGRRKLNVIRSNAQRMDNLINDLLAFSRSGRKEMVHASLDMEALVWSVWKELTVVNPERRIEFSVQKLPQAMGDQALVKEVLVNLFANAIKFTKPRDTARIEVGAYPEKDTSVYYVKDNGAGFDMQYYDKLFGVFQRLHSSDEFEGTGVGLAIVERIVRRHGGRVWAEGKVGGGAIFYFTLTKKE